MAHPLEPDRSALVTGAASGFGLAISRALTDSGARVGMFDRDEGKLTEAAEALGPAATPLVGDVTSEADVNTAVESFSSENGLDAVVVSAGVIHIKPLGEVTLEDWRRTLDINLTGAFLVARAAAPHLSASGRGRFVAISSDAGRRGMESIAAYSASKFGLIGLTESLAMELSGDGVTANCVCPVGVPSTGMGQSVLAWKIKATGKDPDEIVEAAGAGNPIGRNATEDDVTAAVMFLLGPEASFLTGVSLDVDGGARLGSKLPGT